MDLFTPMACAFDRLTIQFNPALRAGQPAGLYPERGAVDTEVEQLLFNSSCQLLPCLFTGLMQSQSRTLQISRLSFDPLLKLFDLEVEVLRQIQFLVDLLQVGDQLRDIASVLLLKFFKIRLTFPEFLQSHRIELYTVPVALGELNRLLDTYSCRPHLFDPRFEIRLYLSHLLHLSADLSQQIQQAYPVPTPCRNDSIGLLIQLLRIVEKVHLRLKCFRLLRVQICLLQFSGLKLIELNLVTNLPLPVFQRFKTLLEIAHGTPAHLIPLKRSLDGVKIVNHTPVILIIKQVLMVVLSMKVNQVLADLLQHSDPDRSVINKTATAGVANFTPEDQDLGRFNRTLLKKLLDPLIFAGVNLGFDDRLGRSLANQFGIGPLSEDHIERPDDDRFSGACLTRQDVQARFETDLQFIDESKILDVE